MPSFLRSKRFWLLSILGVVVLLGAYVGWRLVTTPVNIDESPELDSSLDQKSAESTPQDSDSMEAETPEATDDAASPDTSTGSTTADGVDDFGACDSEAQTYCSGFYGDDWQTFATENGYTSASWKLGLVDCLGQHEDELSQACSDSLDRRQDLNDAMNTACQSDRAMYCKGVEPSPGSEPQVDCLKEHYDELSAECATALDAHEAAKPQ
jgi:hypothetical protein